ncbi:MAG: hypothetical protein HRT57_01535, partial [Crocinitomicaceae bacterium]|nr:hypothetical protein [Crocinitomicaceae bacterium]
AEQEAKIAALLKDGKEQFDSEKFEIAKGKYEEVLVLDNSNAIAKSQIEKINNELAALKSETQKEEDFNKLKNEGFALADQKDYSGAKSKLNEALSLKDDQSVKDKIKEIEDAEKAIVANNEIDEEFNGLLADAKYLGDQDKFDQAIAKYKEALLVKPSDPAPSARIAELEEEMKDSAEQTEKDKEYDAFMKKGEELLAKEEFLKAIKEFNSALTVKPEERAPVDRAAEAEKLAKESTSDFDRQIKKNLDAADKKIDENNYTRALEIIANTEKMSPEEPRVKQLRERITLLKKQDKAYDDLMTAGNTLANAKDYKEAKLKYEAASLKKPSLDLPKEKIEEMKGLIKNAASAAQKDELYSEYMSKGAKRQIDEEFEFALSSYQDALSIKAGDVAATNKINEIQQILDNQANANASAIKNKNEFDAFIKAADELFSGKTYPEAKRKYEEALGVFSDNTYAQLQVEECVRLSKLVSITEEEKQYQKIIASADENFDIENYDKAIMRYKTAVSLRKGDPYPKKRLAEIDAILNPQTQAQAELKDLGTPFSGSILDGTFALQDAEKQRKLANKTAVQKEHSAINNKNTALTKQKTKDQYDNAQHIYNVLSKIQLDGGESDLGRQETVLTLREIELAHQKQERENQRYEHLENISDQEVLYSVNREVALDYGIRDGVYAENAKALSYYAGEIQDAEAMKNSAERGEIYAQNKNINTIYQNIQSEMIDDFAERDQVRQEVYDTRKEVAIEFTAISKDNYNRLIETQDVIASELDKYTQKQIEGVKQATANNEELKDISDAVQAVSDARVGIEDQEHYDTDKGLTNIKAAYQTKMAEDAKATLQNNDDILVMKYDVDRREQIQAEAEKEQHYKADRNMAIIKEEMIGDQKERDDSRQALVVELRIGERELTEANFEMSNNEHDQRIAAQARIEEGVKENSEVLKLASASHTKKVEYVERMDKKARTDFSGLSISDEAERLNKLKEINDVYASVREDAAKARDKNIESGQALKEIKHVLEQNQANQAIGEDDKHYDATKKIHAITDERNKTVKVANSLGEEYPEGVSQESFSQNDQNGLMKTIITRRVVVIDGHADVYVRTQSAHATTFSKNGKPSLQHVWNSQTQGPHLVRHY